MRTSSLFALLITLAGFVLSASAQKATERYVPIGESPGLSGVETVMGTVEAVDAGSGVLTIRAATGPRQVETDAGTRIWLDRTALGATNLDAGIAECRAGRTVEVKLDADGRVAEWIKIRAPAGP